MKTIQLAHGSGGKLTHQLIKEVFQVHFPDQHQEKNLDAAFWKVQEGHLGFTTDAYVVDPIFFPGGDIGKLAVSGTVNDLAVSGYIPEALSAAFIIEEGFSYNDLEQVVISMAREARMAGVQVITGDTKVVNRGKCDRLFITTAGIGRMHSNLKSPLSPTDVQPGDKILISGSLGDHGIAVLSAREKFPAGDTVSDVKPLNSMTKKLLDQNLSIRFMRDLTRGGLATALNELAADRQLGITIEEQYIPVTQEVAAICEMLGLDPLYLANEGKLLLVTAPQYADEALRLLQADPSGKNAAIIGDVHSNHQGLVVMKTGIGGQRIVNMLTGDQLPRIC